MTDKTEAQPEALRLADLYTAENWPGDLSLNKWALSAATELRRQHAEIQQIKAQLAARQAVPDSAIREALLRARDWFESQAKVVSKGCGSPWNLMQLRDERDAADTALSAAPPPPEREPLSQEQIDAALIAWFGHDLANDDQVHRDAMCDAINAAHGIGATNDNP